MPKRKLLVPSAMLLFSGCALFSPPPIAASCPPPPPVPLAVTGYVSPPTNLIEDSGRLLQELQSDLLQSLKKASEALTSQ